MTMLKLSSTGGGAFYTCAVAVFLFILNALPVFADDITPGTPAPAIPNIDVMAARMMHYQDTYRQIRDDSLATFVKDHPNVPVDDEIKAFMGLAAYLCVWDDFYGENLWSRGSRIAERISSKATPEWQANMFLQEVRLGSSHSSADSDAQYINFAALKLVETDYPFELKMQGCATALGNLANYKTESNGDPNGNSFKSVPYLLKAWGDGYHQMIKGKFSHEQIDDAGANLLCACQNDEKMLNLAIAQIDEVFNESDSSNPVKLALDGQYFVNAAWCARGSNWASSVTDEGWQHFKERLAKADDILETAYAQYPAEGELARSMIDVDLGQGQGRDRMEMWFQRAIKANPNDFGAYKSKEWYLQPRWYGSVEDLVSFGKECMKTGNWVAKIPMIFPASIAEASDQDSTLYSRDDIWKPLEEVYTEYLSHYPQSVNYRTWFAKHAADGGHLDVAREQLRILGSNWDHNVLSESDYAALIAKINSK